MTKAKKIPGNTGNTSTLQEIAVADLTLSSLNPRQDVSATDITALADSIRAIGLLQSLCGLKTRQGIEIVAGGRRLRALQQLAETQDVPSVPVIVTTDVKEAQAWAAAENIQRVALHPADEVRAYAAMVETGASADKIATAFGVTLRHVAGRMKLAQLPPVILDALKSNTITLDVAAAYAISSDPERIIATYQALEGTYAAANPATIRKRLMGGSAGGEDQLARFVGRARYEAVGGTITEDLFGEEVYFDDPILLASLADTRLGEEAEKIRAEGWVWVDADFARMDWQDMQRFGRTYPARADLSADEAAQYDALAEKVEYGEATSEEDALFETLDAKLQVETYTDTQKAHAGAFLAVCYDGSMDVVRGLIRPEDREVAAAAGICAPVTKLVKRQEPKGPYSAALAADLAAIRTCAVQTALLSKPELTLDLLSFALTQPAFAGHMPVGISAKTAVNTVAKGEGLRIDPRIDETGSAVPMTGEDAADAFMAFRAKTKKDRNAILTAIIARSIGLGLADECANPFAELIATLSGADIRRVWTPTSAFLARLKSAQLDGILAEITGRPVSPAFARASKRDKVARLHALFKTPEGQRGLTSEAKARLAAWLPAGLAVAPPKKAAGTTSKKKAA